MLYYTHLVFSILIGLYLQGLVGIINLPIYYLGLVLGSFLLDVDSASSKIGRKLGVLSKLIEFFFNHRTFFHSLTFVVAVFLITYFINEVFGYGLLIGCLSHMVLDALTKKGIMPLYPLKLKIKGVVKTGGIFELIFFVLLVCLLVLRLGTGHGFFS